jgi:hypothetical protein
VPSTGLAYLACRSCEVSLLAKGWLGSYGDFLECFCNTLLLRKLSNSLAVDFVRSICCRAVLLDYLPVLENTSKHVCNVPPVANRCLRSYWTFSAWLALAVHLRLRTRLCYWLGPATLRFSSLRCISSFVALGRLRLSCLV